MVSSLYGSLLQLPMAQSNLRGQRVPDIPRETITKQRETRRRSGNDDGRRSIMVLTWLSFQLRRKLTARRWSAGTGTLSALGNGVIEGSVLENWKVNRMEEIETLYGVQEGPPSSSCRSSRRLQASVPLDDVQDPLDQVRVVPRNDAGAPRPALMEDPGIDEMFPALTATAKQRRRGGEGSFEFESAFRTEPSEDSCSLSKPYRSDGSAAEEQTSREMEPQGYDRGGTRDRLTRTAGLPDAGWGDADWPRSGHFPCYAYTVGQKLGIADMGPDWNWASEKPLISDLIGILGVNHELMRKLANNIRDWNWVSEKPPINDLIGIHSVNLELMTKLANSIGGIG
ncbi:hypothetical protein WN48_10780 [Eufriesea mexicana]|uniref:Uncharacterized protein n=1 Tax=Eufriesea mexicana TaxID=516756 RepID=A0A310SHT5_9HYME|nr:hypothetical protein WN48_10780 [Eufriesea mexicana]